MEGLDKAASITLNKIRLRFPARGRTLGSLGHESGRYAIRYPVSPFLAAHHGEPKFRGPRVPPGELDGSEALGCRSWGRTGAEETQMVCYVASGKTELTRVIWQDDSPPEKAREQASYVRTTLNSFWVAIKELKLNYHNPDTKLFAVYPCHAHLN